MEELERARFAVDEYENYVSVIRSVHKECGEAWDWLHARDTPPPAEPRLGNGCEAEAQKAYDGYVPSTFDKIFHRIKKRTARLLRSVEEARRKDQEDYKKACEAHSQEMKEWKKINAIATRICAGDLEGYIEAIKELKPLSEIEHLGSSVNISIEKKEIAECTFHVHDETVIPYDVKTLLKSGRLSVKSMPVMKFYELYQDYVCGAALRVAREMLALLPVEKVMINALSNMLNPATGYVEETPILSALVPRETLEGLNFDALDPSDSMKNFVHRMSFKKGKGFERIEAIKL